MDFKEFGYVYTKSVQEVISFGFTAYVWLKLIPDEVKIWTPISQVLDKIGTFIKKCIENAFSLAIMVLGFEVCTYCAARLNVTELATWILFVYVQSLQFFAGIGFSVVTRNIVQEGLEKKKKTKNENEQQNLNEIKDLAKAQILYITVVASIYMLIIVLFSGPIASFFT